MLTGADYSVACRADATAHSASPPITSAQGRQLNLCLWMLLAVMNLIDVLATGQAFDFGIQELNPIVAVFHAAFGMGGIATVKALLLTLLYFLLPFIRTWTRALFAMACTMYLGLAATHIWYLSPLL